MPGGDLSAPGAGTLPTCPECGAPRVEGLDCWGQLGGIIAWESGRPELFAVHFLTVAAYNLQHPAMYEPEAIAGLRATLDEVLSQGLAIEEILRRTRKTYDGARRVRRAEAERRPVLRSWPMTIADVYLPEQPEGAADRVRAWARSIHREDEANRC